MKQWTGLTAAVATLCLLVVAAPAKADFVGNAVTVTYDWPAIGDVLYSGGTAPIAPGGTVFNLDGAVVDVTGSNILLTFSNSWGFSTAAKSFDGIVVSDPGADITGVSLAGTNIAGFVPSDVFFDGSDVYINFPYPPFASVPQGADVSVNVMFAAATPEPSSLALLGTGLVGMVGVLRRRFVKTVHT